MNIIAGDGNCFYRAFLAAILEQLCQEPRQCRGHSLLSALQACHRSLASGDLPLQIRLLPSYLEQVHLGYGHLKVHTPHAQSMLSHPGIRTGSVCLCTAEAETASPAKQ